MSKQYERIFTLNEPNAPRINPALACEIGLNESIILLQIEYWISISDNWRNGRKWTFQSVRDMKKKSFPFWSIATINRAVNSLIKSGYLIEGNYNKHKYDKTRWFALNFEKLNKLKSISVKGYDMGVFQDETGVFQNETTIPETTPENTYNKNNKGALPLPMPVNIYFKMFLKYKGKKHPYITFEQIEDINERIISYCNEYDISEKGYIAIVKRHFETHYDNCDYNINHFANDGIFKVKYYEVVYGRHDEYE